METKCKKTINGDKNELFFGDYTSVDYKFETSYH